MLLQIYPFSPVKFFWIGISLLGAAALALQALLFSFSRADFIVAPLSEKQEISNQCLSLSFSLKNSIPSFPIPKIADDISLSLEPTRENFTNIGPDFSIRLKGSSLARQITLPCRLDLQFIDGQLQFADYPSRFWIELSKDSQERIQAASFIEMLSNEKIEAETFFLFPVPSPILGSQDFSPESPFRLLADAKWLGANLFSEKHGGVQTLRIAIGEETNVYELNERDWLIFEEGKWRKSLNNDGAFPCARIESVQSKYLILHGWENEKHVRLACPLSAIAPLKIQPSDIFHSIRVRSDKQISCMMEKQCLILRSGDWVLKTNGRWKVLRKKEEKEAYIGGKLTGELFLFEKISSNQGQKTIVGYLFSPEKSNMIPIELAVSKTPSRKGVKQ